MLDYSRDYTNHDYLGYKILEKNYLLKFNKLENYNKTNVIIERPSISDMRIAIGIVCAPTPYKDYLEKELVLEFIRTHPEIIKDNHCNKDDLEKIYKSDEPHKHKYLKMKEFRSRYWNWLLNKDIKEIFLSPQQLSKIKEIYDGMSLGKFTPATPTRFAAGTLRPQGSSCFLIAMESDSLKGIYNTLAKQAQISKHAGGIGMWCQNIRSANSYIAGTNGHSNGLKPMLKVFDATSSYVDQSGKRAGSAAVYLEPHHADIIDFIRLKRKKGAETDRARNLFYALWIPDEFFRCLKYKKDWYLFDPAVVPKLYDSYDEGWSTDYLSDEFVNENKEIFLFTYRYRKYIREGKFVRKINPELIMEEVVETVKDSGVPYMFAKDAANRKSNQKNLGVIKSSNLCGEIVIYSDSTETGVCNLHSVCLNKFLRDAKENEEYKFNISLTDDPKYMTFDFDEFGKTVRLVQNNIDRLIDFNYYPTECAERSNLRNRPMGIGVQGEADVLAKLKLPWNSRDANKLRFKIFEKMYFEALSASVELAKINGPYDSFENSPASQGKLQFDLWLNEGRKLPFPLDCDWDSLKQEIQKYGLRNSLFIAPMPTASTSGIMGNSPCFEPFNSLIYIRKGYAGDITLINKYLVKDLTEIGLWNNEMSDKILEHNGSIQDIYEIPKRVRESYLTVYDLEPKDIIDAAYARAWFVDQSQSMNLFLKNVNMKSLTKAWSRAWARGLKTLSYYCRTRPATTAQKAQINKIKKKKSEEEVVLVCNRDDPDCLACGS